MKRIRLAGNKQYGQENIKCEKCGMVIIKGGEPMTPIYYTKDGKTYCSRCA